MRLLPKGVLGTIIFLLKQRLVGFDTPTGPHFDADTTAFFEKHLRSAKLYMEFGSGGSTVLASQLSVPTVSVEGDRFYAKAVRRAFTASTKVTLLTPDLGFTVHWGKPLFRASQKGTGYVTAPYHYLGDSFPDLILIDGRYRLACTLEAARRAQNAGILATLILDDYKDRPNYHEVENYLGTPTMVGRAAVFTIGKKAVPSSAIEKYIIDPS
jgi:hypothetical protein